MVGFDPGTKGTPAVNNTVLLNKAKPNEKLICVYLKKVFQTWLKCLAHLVNAWVVHLDQGAANSLARLDILARALARVLISRTMRTMGTKTKRMWIMGTITIMIFITITFEV